MKVGRRTRGARVTRPGSTGHQARLNQDGVGTTMADLPAGSSAEVTAVEGDPVLVRRMASLGFRPGTVVTCVRRAPLGDPTVYRLRSYDVCLRRREARQVTVSPTDAPIGP